AGIAICGMGGAAIAGDLARSYWEHDSPMPVTVVRHYTPAAYINNLWYILASSYSGNTPETLAAVDTLHERRCQSVLALTSGGELARRAEKHRWRTVSLPSGMMPRAALGYSLGATLMALGRWGVVGNNPSAVAKELESNVAEATAFLESCAVTWGKETPESSNNAKQMAQSLTGHAVIVVGVTGSTDVAAVRLKSQLCENAKLPAFATAIPEANHNEIVGTELLKQMSISPVVVLLRSADDHKDIARQRIVLDDLLTDKGVAVVDLMAKGDNRLQRLLYLVHLGDYISYYAAILNGVDPTPIAPIEHLKAALASHTT
ncbi:MAG: bifunctional phosphoglucose/phosphomannose isomerase, partial [candidate division Zixibacteria bacterium]|nr:bifunctional phosphoglucose/phosphomannose isomerase [candidate division Zixibacteria bacterium]